MKLEDLTNHRIGILGLGQEGQAVLSYLNKHRLEAQIFENNEFDEIKNCTLLFRSPGIWRKNPAILEAEAGGSIITSQTKFFFDNTPATIIGVTGTKGKGTTSSLIYETLKEAGKKTYLTGNIGKLQPLEFLDETTTEDVVVFELSSFQLQDLTKSPHIAICLMTTSDHLDHHSSLAEYHEAKSNITAFQTETDFAIYNADYPPSKKIGELGKGKKFIVSSKAEQQKGAYILEDKILISGIQTNHGNEINTTIDCSNRNLRGAHNLENIAAAAIASLTIGAGLESVSKISQEFKGLEHRLQLVGTFEGVSYYNDSISTVPETTIAALNSFNEPVHLILGGSDKNLKYDSLVTEVASRNNIMSITLLGEVGKKLYNQLLNVTDTPLLGPFTDFPLAIKEITKRVQEGDIVLLSPAAASFGIFKNYAERGNEFKKLVTNFIPKQ